ncbi:MAG: protein-L-isoaspartate(D-aspartate) O-methyltransferase [Candidatus Pacebacteria bacterium]|nr:protein-L-isoaspartate(D-aspartate) O-methyltransferase [Candidatus Paceibacterota bacterium]
MNSVIKAGESEALPEIIEGPHQALMAEIAALDPISETVLAAMVRAPREYFVPSALRHHAYHNSALPIGQGQTISQPSVVARMTEALRLDRANLKVLEVGTGSGWQTAILLELVQRVFTIERHPTLLREALARLQPRLKTPHSSLNSLSGDGSKGWKVMAPFDRIIVTAAAFAEVPPPLLAQLAVKGVMVIPVATRQNDRDQRLLRLTRSSSAAEFVTEDLGPVQFVPLVSGDGGGP